MAFLIDRKQSILYNALRKVLLSTYIILGHLLFFTMDVDCNDCTIERHSFYSARYKSLNEINFKWFSACFASIYSISNRYLTHKSCKNKVQLTDLWRLKIAEDWCFDFPSDDHTTHGARELNQMSWVLVNQWDNECYYYIAHIWRVAMCNNVGKSVMLSLLQDFKTSWSEHW